MCADAVVLARHDAITAADKSEKRFGACRKSPCSCPAPSFECMRLAAERRTTGASSAGALTAMGSSGMATREIVATAAAVVPERHGPALAMLVGGVEVGVVDDTRW